MNEKDFPIHFRYHDAVNALIGNHRYRYERIQMSDLPEMVHYLEGKGFDEFSWRKFEPWFQWQPVQLVGASV